MSSSNALPKHSYAAQLLAAAVSLAACSSQGGTPNPLDARQMDEDGGGLADDASSGDGSATNDRDASGAGEDARVDARDDSGAGDGGGAVSASLAVARKLGRDHFLIGLGNDLADNHDNDGAYTLGVTMDLHYAYLVGLQGQGGWPDWNANGGFVNLLTDSAKRHGTVPMFTLYSMAAWGEANVSMLTNDDFMRPYWAGAKLLFERLGAFGDPSVVQFEPDWWGFTHQASRGNPASLAVHVTSLAPDCAGHPNNLVGMGRCLVTLARKYAPAALIGFHASSWADPDPTKVGEFLTAIGAGDTDILFYEMLDRDAGCFEARVDPNCQRGGTTGWYLDESNQSSPNFREHLAGASAVARAVGKPLLWWQLPLGVPSNTPGGSPGRYRDNRVRYLFSHVDEFIAAGGVGAVFGVGAANQTYITTDNGQFRTAVTRYFQSPVRL